MARVMIAMPTTGTVKTATATSVIEAARALAAAGHKMWIRTVESSNVSVARNLLASAAVAEGASHVLFVDADMTFPAKAVLNLFAADRPLIGAIYPVRHIDLQRLVELTRRSPGTPTATIIAMATDFVVRWPKDTVQIDIAADGLCRVSGIGMGLALIDVRVLQAMIDNGSASLSAASFPGVSTPTWGFFDLLNRESGDQLGEDLSFCARWREQCGGEVWGLATADVGHIGDMTHQGSVLEHYLPDEALIRRTPEPAV